MERDRPSNTDTSLPEPPKDAYESVSRRFTWRSSLFMALVLWLVLMFIVAECAVARNQRDARDGVVPDSVGAESVDAEQTVKQTATQSNVTNAGDPRTSEKQANDTETK